jgi:hypothetical protein
MPRQANQTRQRRGDAVRDAALLAGVSLEHLVRARAVRRLPRPIRVGAGLIAAGAALALAHLAGADLRGGFAAGPPGLLPAMLQGAFDEERPSQD